MMATVIRNGFLWKCHTVDFGGTSGTYTGDKFGTNVDRSASNGLSCRPTPMTSRSRSVTWHEFRLDRRHKLLERSWHWPNLGPKGTAAHAVSARVPGG